MPCRQSLRVATGLCAQGYQARLEKLGLEQFALNPAQSAAFIKAELDKWAAVASSARIQVD